MKKTNEPETRYAVVLAAKDGYVERSAVRSQEIEPAVTIEVDWQPTPGTE